MAVFLVLYCNYPNIAYKDIHLCQEVLSLFFFFLISFKVSGFVIILGRQIITALIYH